MVWIMTKAPKPAPSPPTRRRILAGALALGLLGLAGPTAGPYQRASAQAELRSLSAPEAERRLSEGELMLIDVRSIPEWRQTRIAKGARTITIHDPAGVDAFVEKVAAAAGERDRPIAFICASGVRSAYAYKLMSDAGFTNLYNVTEGMMGAPAHGPGWLKRQLPTEPCEAC